MLSKSFTGACRFLAALVAVAVALIVFCRPAEALTLDEARAQLETLGTELAQLEDELSVASNDLEATKAEIQDTEDAITVKRGELSNAQGELAESTRRTYKMGTLGLLDIIMNAESFEDLVTRIYYADAIQDAQANAVQTVRGLEQELEEKQAQLVETRAAQEAKLSEVEASVAEHRSKVDEAQALYDQLSAEEQARLAAEAAAQAQVNGNGTNTNGLSNAVQAIEEDTPPAPQDPSTGGSGSSGSSGGSSGGSTPAPQKPSYDYSSGDPISIAMQFVGKVPYVYGGNSPEEGFDCSGMVCYVFNKLGKSLPRTTYGQIQYLKDKGAWKTDLSQLNPGDIVFPHSGHVGIYAGDGMFIDAPRPGKYVQYRELYSFYGGGSVW